MIPNQKVFKQMLTKNHSVQSNLESGPINRFIQIEIKRVQQTKSSKNDLFWTDAKLEIMIPWTKLHQTTWSEHRLIDGPKLNDQICNLEWVQHPKKLIKGWVSYA